MDTMDKINQKLSEQGLSGAELTRLIGLKSTGVWSQWNNRRTKPSKKSMLAIAKALHCSVEELSPDKKIPATDGDGLADKIKSLSPQFQEALVLFLELAQENPDTAERMLLFSVQELQFASQSR